MLGCEQPGNSQGARLATRPPSSNRSPRPVAWGILEAYMTVTVDLSDSAIKALDAKTSDDAVANLRLAAAMKLYELGRLSTGAAADLAGLGRVEFLDRLAEFGVNAFQETPEELAHELATLRSFRA